VSVAGALPPNHRNRHGVPRTALAADGRIRFSVLVVLESSVTAQTVHRESHAWCFLRRREYADWPRVIAPVAIRHIFFHHQPANAPSRSGVRGVDACRLFPLSAHFPCAVVLYGVSDKKLRGRVRTDANYGGEYAPIRTKRPAREQAVSTRSRERSRPRERSATEPPLASPVASRRRRRSDGVPHEEVSVGHVRTERRRGRCERSGHEK